MQAVKVFNNNAVSVIMPDGREAILVGNGLGFGRRPGDVIDKNRVSKVYYVQNELQTKFLKMLDNVTPQVMQAAERISLAAEEQGILLSSKSTISLVDHISFALERVEKGTFLPNLMLSETRMLYPKEYAVGQRALELVRQFCGVQLPEDEAGYIALHLVAGAADGALAYDTVKFVMAVKEIICDTYHCTFEEESLETIRLTVHLKFLAARILRHTSCGTPRGRTPGWNPCTRCFCSATAATRCAYSASMPICVRNLITSWIIRSRSICSST